MPSFAAHCTQDVPSYPSECVVFTPLRACQGLSYLNGNAGTATLQARHSTCAVPRQLACGAASTGAAALQMQGKVLSVHYLREDGNYEVSMLRSVAACAGRPVKELGSATPLTQISMQGWGLHVWGDVKAETSWTEPLQPR